MLATVDPPAPAVSHDLVDQILDDPIYNFIRECQLRADAAYKNQWIVDACIELRDAYNEVGYTTSVEYSTGIYELSGTRLIFNNMIDDQWARRFDIMRHIERCGYTPDLVGGYFNHNLQRLSIFVAIPETDDDAYFHLVFLRNSRRSSS